MHTASKHGILVFSSLFFLKVNINHTHTHKKYDRLTNEKQTICVAGILLVCQLV